VEKWEGYWWKPGWSGKCNTSTAVKTTQHQQLSEFWKTTYIHTRTVSLLEKQYKVSRVLVRCVFKGFRQRLVLKQGVKNCSSFASSSSPIDNYCQQLWRL